MWEPVSELLPLHITHHLFICSNSRKKAKQVRKKKGALFVLEQSILWHIENRQFVFSYLLTFYLRFKQLFTVFKSSAGIPDL